VGGVYAGKVAPIPELADLLFTTIRKDKPFKLAKDSTGIGSEVQGKPKPTGTGKVLGGIQGQSAAQNTCSVSYAF
jgi:hypothetical protein